MTKNYTQYYVPIRVKKDKIHNMCLLGYDMGPEPDRTEVVNAAGRYTLGIILHPHVLSRIVCVGSKLVSTQLW